MKKLIALSACVYFVLASGPAKAADSASWAGPGVGLKIHFAGSDKLAAAGAPLEPIFKLADTREFKRQITGKLAAAPQQWLQLFLDKKDQKDRLLPLAEDLLKRELVFELNRSGGASAWGLGICLDSGRANLWSTNLWQFFSDVKGMQPSVLTARGIRGWEAALLGVKMTFRMLISGDWCVVGMGPDPAQTARLLDQIARTKGTPLAEGAWLSFHVDLAGAGIGRVPGLLAAIPHSRESVLEGAFTIQNGTVRSRVSIDLSKEVKWELEPWKVPQDLIKDPLVSFTAIQGIRPWLSTQSWVRNLDLNSVPNQYFVWAQGEMPFLTYGAAPVKGASGVFDRIAPKVPAFIWDRILGFKAGEIAMLTNKMALGWSGLPLVSPFLRPETVSNSEYLLGGLFPVVNSTNPAPSELLAQLSGKTNLCVYEWEFSQERLGQLHVLSQIMDMITPSSLENQPEISHTNSCAQPWITAAGAYLGNSITAITVQSATKLTLIRQSNTGLDGMELLALIRWLDDPRFPLYGSVLPALK